MSESQATEATQAERLAECIAYEEYLSESLDFESIDWMEQVRGWEASDYPNREKLKGYIVKAINISTATLTAQLAAAQAQAKALEAWGKQQSNALEFFSPFQTDLQFARGERAKALKLPKPQPVTAESLARIARVAQQGEQLQKVLNEFDGQPEYCGGSFQSHQDALAALTPEDRALIDVLAGGA